MKNRRTHLLLAGAILFSICATAQTDKVPINEPDYNKPHLFDGLPARIPVNITTLIGLIEAPVGKTASLDLSAEAGKQFNGEVVSVSDKSDARIQSVVLRSNNYNGARLTVSRVQNEDGTYLFTGRIISFKSGDLYELKNEAGTYVLIKRNYYDLVNE